MNKYQKALDSLTSYIEEQVPLLKGFTKKTREVEELQELVDKAKPQKPEFDYDDDTYKCPCCGEEHETYYDGYFKKFCDECG